MLAKALGVNKDEDKEKLKEEAEVAERLANEEPRVPFSDINLLTGEGSFGPANSRNPLQKSATEGGRKRIWAPPRSKRV